MTPQQKQRTVFSGNWRDYITISDRFRPKDRVLIEKVLDDIVATGSDGIDLLMKAYESRVANDLYRKESEKNLKKLFNVDSTPSDQKILFIPSEAGVHSQVGPGNYGSHLLWVLPGVINIDLRQARNLQFKDTDGRLASVSLTGMVVHELFHQADPNFRMDVMRHPQKQQELSDFMVVSNSLNAEEKTRVVNSYSNEMDKFIERFLQQDSEVDERLAGIQRALLMLSFRDAPQDDQPTVLNSRDLMTNFNFAMAAWQQCQINNAAVIYDAIRRDTRITADFSLRLISDQNAVHNYEEERAKNLEGDATSYTDVFMKKHFPQEPWRGVYSNGYAFKQEIDSPIVREGGCGEVISGHYQAETISLSGLGDLSQPHISVEPSSFCNKSQPTRH